VLVGMAPLLLINNIIIVDYLSDLCYDTGKLLDHPFKGGFKSSGAKLDAKNYPVFMV
jgi:hypothetical protein